ncbi:ATP-binding protein [Streptomyces sp. NBC_00872]|uniref:ATP-binding protein n=1 Tax=Streptomyces sp. NBC_00872 TaxID=2903686 RepID=UPI003866709C|nr:ATP-binding protein [Streptomyces sp. NBC_00872]
MADTDITQYRQELTIRPGALAGIRQMVSVYVRLWGFAALAETTALCTHELLSNVGKHTDSAQCVLTLRRRLDGVRVVVSDTSGELPVVREPDWAAESGRGLVVLESMADTWGVEGHSLGKDVWFEIRRPSREVVA